MSIELVVFLIATAFAVVIWAILRSSSSYALAAVSTGNVAQGYLRLSDENGCYTYLAGTCGNNATVGLQGYHPQYSPTSSDPCSAYLVTVAQWPGGLYSIQNSAGEYLVLNGGGSDTNDAWNYLTWTSGVSPSLFDIPDWNDFQDGDSGSQVILGGSSQLLNSDGGCYRQGTNVKVYTSSTSSQYQTQTWCLDSQPRQGPSSSNPCSPPGGHC